MIDVVFHSYGNLSLAPTHLKESVAFIMDHYILSNILKQENKGTFQAVILNCFHHQGKLNSLHVDE